MKPITKAVIGIVSTAILAASLTACTTKPVTENENITIDGVYVNESYESAIDNKNVEALYVFYTLTPAEKNLSISCAANEITIGENDYYSEINYNQCTWAKSYYHSDVFTDVYAGDKLKAVSVFEVPKNDLSEGKEITFDLCEVDGDLLYLTDDIIFCKSAKEVAKQADPEGFKKEQNNRKAADKETADKVRNAINGHRYWTSLATVEFMAPNYFVMDLQGMTVSGKYSVKNGYISCKNDHNGYITEIPYSWDNGEIQVELYEAFG